MSDDFTNLMKQIERDEMRTSVRRLSGCRAG